MFLAAGRALAELSPAKAGKDERLLPPASDLRAVARAVAAAVARQAQADRVAEPASAHALAARIAAYVWEPRYGPYQMLP